MRNKWRAQNVDFVSLKSSSPCQFLGSSNSRRYHWMFKLIVATWKSEFWAFLLFLLWKELRLLSQSPCFLLSKNKSFNRNEAESKMENPTHSFREMNHMLQLVKALRIQSKIVSSWMDLTKEKEGIFCNVCFARRNFF